MEYISRKFRVLYFFSSLAIVLIHSGIIAGIDSYSLWCNAVIDVYTQRLTCWAVPFFFLAAGYWFSQGAYMRGEESYLLFFKKKVRSLVVPYFSFIMIALIVSLPGQIIANIIAHRYFLENTVFFNPTLYDVVNQIFAITIPEPKPLGVMWFIRTLFFLFLLAPLYRIVVNRFPIVLLMGVTAFFCFSPGRDIPFFPMWFGASIWFFLGIWIGAAYSGNLVRLKVSMWVPIAILIVCCLWTLKIVWINDIVVKMLFIIGIWFIYDYVDPFLPIKLPKFVSWSFWLYCTHNMLVFYAIPLCKFVFGHSDVLMCIVPILVFVLAIVLSLSLAYRFEKKFPSLFTVLIGGRCGKTSCDKSNR